jgi:hypothetical protein
MITNQIGAYISNRNAYDILILYSQISIHAKVENNFHPAFTNAFSCAYACMTLGPHLQQVTLGESPTHSEE